ncbi:MAG: pyrrolo-quinoline quinone [Verrucomicrobia bacterium]|nr:pyrrolo-quinoline quinone [Verrucomicrobiota bacterium]
MTRQCPTRLVIIFSLLALPAAADTWSQWRGPARDGRVEGAPWPAKLGDSALERLWRVPLGPGYSGPLVSRDLVFVTETHDKRAEVVRALDRRTGEQRWVHEWPGAISVPFFAKSRGDWIRATPAFDGESLFVAGMRDVLVALEASSGRERWRIDFAARYDTGAPDFGLVCSPLVDEGAVYLQAANSVVKVAAADGQVIWRALEGKSGMMSAGAFSSPVIAPLLGTRQLVVQTREKLAGLELSTGKVLWEHSVPSYRGMNILTPTVAGDAIFTSSYQNKSWLYRLEAGGPGVTAREAWSNNAQGYMSSPVIIAGHAYLHLGNGRFTCIRLSDGERTWTSDPFGKYASLVAQGNRILALDERGILLLIQADPAAFQLVGQAKVAEEETWAHLAIVGDELVVRDLKAISAFRWRGEARFMPGE